MKAFNLNFSEVLTKLEENPRDTAPLRTALLLLLRIRSAYLGIFKFLKEFIFPLIQQYFCAVYDYVGKLGLSKGYQNPKRKLGVTTQFSEIIEENLERNCHTFFVF